MNDIVFYHGKCVDGYAATNNLINNFVGDIEDCVVNYGDMTVLMACTGISPSVHTLWFVDFTPTREAIITLINKGYHVNIIDHHITAEKIVESIMIDPSLTDIITGGKLRYVLSHEGFCGTSLVKALGGFINCLSDVEIGPNRYIEDYANDHVLCKINTNLTELKLDRSMLTELDHLIEVYDLWDMENPKFLAAQHLYAYLDHIKLLDQRPRYSIIHHINASSNFIGGFNSPLDTLRFACNVGENMFHAKLAIAKNIISQMKVYAHETMDGEYIETYIGNAPPKFATIMGLAMMSVKTLDRWVMFTISHDYRRVKTVVEVRSDVSTDSRVVSERLGGGGHRCASGITFDCIVGDQDKLIYDLVDAMHLVK